MKRKILFSVTFLIILGLSAMQSCKKDTVVTPTEYMAAMPAAPTPTVDQVIPFTGSGQTIDLAWTGTATDAVKWDVYFGSSKSPALVASNVTANSFTAHITKGGTYYWGVSTTDSRNVNSESSVWSFQVNSNPAVASAPAPAADAIDVSRAARISWVGADPEGDHLTYDVYLAKTNPPTTMVATDIADTTYAVSKPLTASTIYYWKVVTKDPYGGKSTSPVWKFTTTANLITAYEGDYNADEPAEDYSYGVTFTAATATTIKTDNYWNSGWAAVFTLDLAKLTYSMPLTVWGNYSATESGVIEPSTGKMTGTYTIWYKTTTIAEQGVHTYTRP